MIDRRREDGEEVGRRRKGAYQISRPKYKIKEREERHKSIGVGQKIMLIYWLSNALRGASMHQLFFVVDPLQLCNWRALNRYYSNYRYRREGRREGGREREGGRPGG